MTIPQLLLFIIARFFPDAVFYKPTQDRRVALTIDDAPTPGVLGEESTEQILAAVAQHNQQFNRDQTSVRGTFFIITEHLRENSTIIEQILQ
jgi:peptidoglycan/xylan/chitin deacetylase (PgdA/CDA1 family)